jgi:predicted NUDIX family phosphoesterase
MPITDPGWDRIVDAIDGRFGIIDHGRYKEPLEDKPELDQQVSYVTFKKNGQTYKMERVARPAIIDKKSHYHKSIGSGVRFENIYDADQTTFITHCYVKAGDDWEPVEASELAV